MYKNDSEEKMKIGDEKNMYNMRMKQAMMGFSVTHVIWVKEVWVSVLILQKDVEVCQKLRKCAKCGRIKLRK